MEVMDEEVGVKVVEFVELAIKWAGKEVAVLLPADRQTVADLRRELYLLTRVPPERQKLLGLKPSPGKSLDDVPTCSHRPLSLYVHANPFNRFSFVCCICGRADPCSGSRAEEGRQGHDDGHPRRGTTR